MTTRNTGIRSILTTLAALTVAKNVRLPNRYNVEAMADDIATNGLDTPIMVWQPQGKTGPIEVIRGHRRRKGLLAFKASNPEGFAEMFPKGIPCELRVGIDAKEAARLKVDHGNVLGLSDPHEIQMAASMLFDNGATELEVAVALRGLFEETKPMRGKNLLKVQALEAKLPGATALEAEEIRKGISKIVKAYHRGRVQILKTVWRCPEIVTQARFFRACGVRPEGVAATTYLPTVTTAQAKTLEKAFAKDLEIRDDRTGVSRYSKRLPGPNFAAAWEALCKEDQEETPDTPKKKALSGKAIRESAGGYNSVGFRAVCGLHCGDTPDVGQAVKEADELLYTAELVAKHDTSLWEAVVEARKVIEQRIIAEARAEAEAKAAAEGTTLDPETGEPVSTEAAAE
jgi:ParB/Sulfiredoxin domain